MIPENLIEWLSTAELRDLLKQMKDDAHKDHAINMIFRNGIERELLMRHVEHPATLSNYIKYNIIVTPF